MTKTTEKDDFCVEEMMKETETENSIERLLEMEFASLVPNIVLTGSEIAAIKNAFTRWFEQKKQASIIEQKEYGFDPIIPMVNINELLRELSSK